MKLENDFQVRKRHQDRGTTSRLWGTCCGFGSVTEYLPSMCEVLGSVLSTRKGIKERWKNDRVERPSGKKV